MPFEIEVRGSADRTLLAGLTELVGGSAIRSEDGSVVLSVVDQAALVTVVARLHDLGLAIERIERRRGALN